MRPVVELALVVCCALWLGACGDDGVTPPTDAGADGAADGGDGGYEIASPAPPEAPAAPARPCPSGFAATADGDCDPFPGGALSCGAGEIQVPGQAACIPLGPPCPASGEWATDLPAGATVRYVWAGAPAGGDGTQAAPFPTIGEAARASGAGDTIAVAAGTYDEAVALRGGVTLHGACATDTIIAPTFGAAATLSATGRDAVARNITVSGRGAGVSLDGDRSLHLEDVIVADNLDFGARILRGATLTADRLIVRGTRPALARGSFGRGIDVEGGAVVDIQRALIADNTDFGIFGAVDADLRLRDLVVRDTRAQESDGSHGRALSLAQGATAAVERAIFEDSVEIGVFVHGEGTTATLEDTVIRRVASSTRRGGAESGIGLTVEVGAAVTARGLRVEECHFGGVISQGEGSHFGAEELVVARVAPDNRGDLGIGLAVERGATMTIARAVVRDTHTLALSVKGEGTVFTGEDVDIDGVAPRAHDGELGSGVGMSGGSRAVITRLRVTGAAGDGLYVADAGTHLTLTDSRVTRGRVEETTGFGLLVRDGAAVEGARVEFRDLDEIAILVGLGGARVEATDVIIGQLVERPHGLSGALYGAGVQVETGGSLGLTRALIEEVAHRGIGAFGGTATVVDTVIQSTTESTLGDIGFGVEAADGGEVNLERVAVRDAARVGVVAFSGSRITAAGLEVTDPRSSSVDGRLGRGVVAQGSGRIELRNALLVGNREVGLLAHGARARIDAQHITIVGVREAACGEDGSCAGGGGFGASAVGGAVTLTDFLVEGGALAGVQLADGGELDLTRGAIVGHPIGINIQGAPEYDLTRLMNDVRFVGNMRNIDGDYLPVPDSSLAAAGLIQTPDEVR